MESHHPLTPAEDEPVPEGHKSGFVALAGRPNVGKSTLLNALLQQKIAIVTPRPQTTRSRQLGILTTSTYQIVFVDTPGLIKPRHKLDEAMMETAQAALLDADVILWLVEASEPPGPADRIIAEQLRGLREAKVILALNKSDLLPPEKVTTAVEAYRALLPDAPWILLSALKGQGCEELQQLLVDALPEGPRYYPTEQVTESYVREIAAELIREQLFLQLREEVPYGSVVRVEEFKEREDGSAYINAVIYLERDSHKRIVIGHKGEQLRQIGAAARIEIEKLTEGKVFLDLWVKVEPHWRQNERAVKRFGYG
ncbi:MAG: GTPase Era [Chloroflexota bacterium]